MKVRTITDRFIVLAEKKFSSKEIIGIFILILLSLSGFVFWTKAYFANIFLTDRILYTGSVVEGVLGEVKSVDLSSRTMSQSEESIVPLLFGSLLKRAHTETGYVLDLASNLVASEDGLSYTVSIPQNAVFHDGSSLTSDSVIDSFLVYSQNKNGLESVKAEKVDEQTVYFKLEKANPNFIQNLDFPIFKKDYNPLLETGFVGSGPFKIAGLSKDGTGSISSMDLSAFDEKQPKSPYLQKYTLKFFDSEDAIVTAWKNKEIGLLTGIRNNLIAGLEDTDSAVATSSMSGTFLLFINQTKNKALQEESVRHYISQSINRGEIVNVVFSGYAKPIDNIRPTTATTTSLDDLKKSGFTSREGSLFFTSEDSEGKKKEDKLSLSISTLNTPELVATSELLKRQLNNVGIDVSITSFDKEDLEKNLKTKDFDLFLFGFYASSNDVYYNFFHSSQTIYPKLNISGYASKKSDSVLEKLKSNSNRETQEEYLGQFAKELANDMPVIFLYKSELTVLHRKNLTIKLPDNIEDIKDRYQFVTDWYTEIEKTFSFFSNNKLIKFIETII